MAAEERKRILYVITDPVSLRFLRGQLSILVQRGFEVHVATAGSPALDEFARTEGVIPHRVRLTRSPHPLRDALALVDLLRLIHRVRPDLVNVSTPKAGLVGGLAAWLSRVSVRVYVVRGLRFELATGWRRRVLRLLEGLAMRASTHVVFNSRSLRRLTESEGLIAAGRGIVIASGSGNGVDVSRFIDLSDGPDERSRLGIPADVGVVGFVGRLARGKGVDDLLRAFDVVGDSFHDVRLVVIGEVDKADPVDSTTVDRLSNDPSVMWVGWREDLQSLYPVFDVLAFPSYREGLPNVVLEAQAAGVPVVAYAATGTTDAVLDGVTGVLVEVGSVRALSGAIEVMLKDEARRKEMGRAAQRWVATEFSQDRFWDELIRYYMAWLD